MKITLVASRYLPQLGGLERHVDQLARGLAQRGAQVEVLTQGGVRAQERSVVGEGVVVRRFPTVVGPLRFAVAPGLWERLRVAAQTFDLVDTHTAHTPLALAAGRAGFRRLVFTPRAPLQQLLSWPYGHAIRAVVFSSSQIVCASVAELDLLCRRFPSAASRTSVVPLGLDAVAIRAAKPLACFGNVVLTVGRLERTKRIDRVIAAMAAMASLNPPFRLVVVGEGPASNHLTAYTADLRLSSCVEFVGSVPDVDLYRWLRTARVGVALADAHSSGLQLTEALAAGVPVVASDIPVHREAAGRAGRAAVIFVTPAGSPLELADAIFEASQLRVDCTTSELAVCSWESVVERMWALYRQVITGKRSFVPRGKAADKRLVHAGDLHRTVVDNAPPLNRGVS